MRFFRIPAFTGIETHRDDADRGSLRVVEGCVPHGPGGLRSGPVWEKLGEVGVPIDTDQNKLVASDDGNGNSIICVARTDEIHDIRISSTEHTEVTDLGPFYEPATFEDAIYRERPATFQPIGDRMYAFGDGSAEAVLIGKGPPGFDDYVVSRSDSLYGMEWSTFPKCQYYVQGPKKTIFAAGNPNKPLRVYISEPKSLSDPYRDFPYSTEETAEHAGVLSTVDILSSNASRITALSTRGDQVVVHTDKGCHLLYSPKSDQAETGFRVEQVPATNFSGAVNSQVVAGESGSQHFWMGHDGQIYKDEAASRGAEDFKGYADAAQANWKAKGTWEEEHPIDLSDAFATYDPQSGMYWVYTRSDEFTESISGDAPGYPVNLQVVRNSPSEPRGFESEIVHDPPNAPTITGSQFTPDPPLQPRNFDAQWIRPPDVPSNLESTALLEPSKPRFFTKNQVFIEPSTPMNLDPKSVVYDPPLVPTSLSFGTIFPDSPALPESFQISNFQRDPLFEFTFPSSWDGTTVGEHRKRMFEYAGARIQRIVTNSLTVEIDVLEEEIDGSGGIWGNAGVTDYVAQGMEGMPVVFHTLSYARPTKGFVRLDTKDIASLDYSTDPVFGLPSLYFVAMHELLHCLGLGIWWYDLNAYPSSANVFLNQHNPQYRPYISLVPILRKDSQGNVTVTGHERIVDEDRTETFKHLYQYKYIFGFDLLKGLPDEYCEHYSGAYGESGYKFYFEQEPGVNHCMGSLPIFQNHLYDIETPNLPSFGGVFTEQIPTITEKTTYQQTSCYIYAGVAITYPCFRKEIFTGMYGTGDTRYISKITAGLLRDIGYTVDYSQIDQIPTNSFGSATINSNCAFGLSPQQATEGMQTQFNSGSVNSVTKPL